MLATLLSAALSIPAAGPPTAPAPLPDRWLLKLPPTGFPKLPDPFWADTWWDNRSGRAGRGWAEWIVFARGTGHRPPDVTLTQETYRRRFGQGDGGEPAVTVRTAELAFQGPL